MDRLNKIVTHLKPGEKVQHLLLEKTEGKYTPKKIEKDMFNPDKLPVVTTGKDFDIRKQNVVIPPKIRANILDYLDQIDVRFEVNGYNVADHLNGPLNDVGPGKRYADLKEILSEIMKKTNCGENHLYWREMQKRYCNGDKLANFVLPVISFTRKNTRPPLLTHHIILSDPDDCQHVARSHVKKMPDQALFVANGVLSNIDVNRWKEQRAHLNEAFLPLESLQQLLPVSEARARKANTILLEQAKSAKGGVVQMNEFLLYETMAQLLLALFGMDEEIMNQYNKPIREAFAISLEATGGAVGGSKPDLNPRELQKATMILFQFLSEFMQMKDAKGVEENMKTGCPIRGPLSARILDISDTADEKYFNAATFLFAGHDTTANTMSWLLYECCKQPSIQEQLQEEADNLFKILEAEKRDLTYKDLYKLPFMTRCITETLRLWPVVPNGTFREFQFDDYIKGPGGKQVKVPKGTYVQITNWMRHRSEELWGPDAEEFNPNRDFRDDELWGGKAFAAYNPSSRRFSPFTFGPRDCMGKNFAQMEMRVILANLLHNFKFELASPTKEADPKTFLGVNRATLGPRDTGIDESKPAALGIYMKVTPRF